MHSSRLRNPFILIVILFVFCGCGSHQFTKQRVPFPIGDATVEVRKIQSTNKKDPSEAVNYLFFNLHENENTSVKAAKKFLKNRTGVLYYLHQKKKRNIVFNLNGETFKFDPNRIFTNEGIRKTLVRHGNFNRDAHREVKKFSDFLLRTMAHHEAEAYITLHNNSELAYSLASYVPGGQYEKDAAKFHQNESMDVDDFYFVTDSTFFRVLVAEDFNTILQDNANGTDDGSLSIYAGQHGIRYINVEAQHGHKDTQLKMIKVVDQLLYVPGS